MKFLTLIIAVALAIASYSHLSSFWFWSFGVGGASIGFLLYGCVAGCRRREIFGIIEHKFIPAGFFAGGVVGAVVGAVYTLALVTGVSIVLGFI